MTAMDGFNMDWEVIGILFWLGTGDLVGWVVVAN